jgi:chromosome segregation ATPase
VTLNRLKEQVEKLNEEKNTLNFSKTQADDNLKRSQRQLRELREEFSDVQKRELEYGHKNSELVSTFKLALFYRLLINDHGFLILLWFLDFTISYFDQ